MTTTVPPEAKVCPAWCVSHERTDQTTEERDVHPDDYSTWHNATKRVDNAGLNKVEVELRLFDPDVRDEGESYEPMLYVDGWDSEGPVPPSDRLLCCRSPSPRPSSRPSRRRGREHPSLRALRAGRGSS